MRDRMQATIDHIEAHLTEEMDVHDIAARAYVSAFHFQRVFSALCGMPRGEYIRCRRLTLAAQEPRGMSCGYPTKRSSRRRHRS